MILFTYIAIKLINMIIMTIGKQIKNARESKGIKQGFIAEKAGITREHFSTIENDHNQPSKTLLKLLEIILETEFKIVTTIKK